MEITKFTASRRENALLLGDYNFYRAQTSRRLLTLRKKLGRTSKGKKYTGRAPVTAQDIGENHEFVHLLLLTSERAWAHAMHMKSTSSNENADQGVTGSTRRHIISRLHKASTFANDLLVALTETPESGAKEIDILEAKAYVASLAGSIGFEKRDWKPCLTSYSEVRIIYAALYCTSKDDVFKEQLANTVDPSIRYAAYQLRMPRSRPIPALARESFPRSDLDLVALVERIDPTALNEDPTKAKGDNSEQPERLAKNITWRSRTVELEDAAISQALASVDTASASLARFLESPSNQNTDPKEKAAAYDDVLISSQDAVDATKHAIDELASEGVGQGDKRMQALQITRTAVNYALVSWRVGRNRVLVGAKDGTVFEESAASKPRKPRKDGKEWSQKPEGTGRRLARLRERVVLYDATLQSVDSVKELPGVAADKTFMSELQSKREYFQALRCLAIARSHIVLSNRKNALALFSHAFDLSNQTVSSTSKASQVADSGSPPTIDISSSELQYLNHLLQAEVSRHRALVELETLDARQQSSARNQTRRPLVETLETYPSMTVSKDSRVPVDLKNIVSYPPTKIEPVPVKPIFLDVAWNYIDYPGRAARDVVQHGKGASGSVDGAAKGGRGDAKQPDSSSQPQKKGWFGFGR
ncbi:MAG: hypothetical protein M4579_001709 [Chaenotheca gracillima]|nr:MAG: hypothetical protein M4579_001709 [Chaenotheca gracillima]